jgi:hypothetical protein
MVKATGLWKFTIEIQNVRIGTSRKKRKKISVTRTVKDRVGKNPGFFKKPNPGGLFGFYWVLLGFIGYCWVLLGFFKFLS